MRRVLLAMLGLACVWGEGRAAECVALTGAKVYLPAGPRADAVIVMKDGAIFGVGGVIPDGCRVIDATGKVVTAGFIDAHTQIGLVEIELEASTVDAAAVAEGDSPAVRAAFSVADAYNPRSTLIPVTRLGGVTSVVTEPFGGVVSGRSAWVDLAGGTQHETVRQAALALHVQPLRGLRATSWNLVRSLFEETQRWSKRKAEWEKNQIPRLPFDVRDLRAVEPVVEGRMPLVAHVDRASDIEAALRLAAELELHLVIDGGAEAWLLADDLGKRKVPVILDAYRFSPMRVEDLASRPDNAALLQRAGVPVVLSAYDTHNARTLRQLAGNAVREGLDHASAIRAITLNPAEAFGMRRHGRLEAGAVANLVVWSGDPLELSTRIEHLFIGGREIALESRQTGLRDRYRTLPEARGAATR